MKMKRRTPAAGAGTAAQANHAAESYQRYGQTPPVAPAPSTPAPSPAPTAAPDASAGLDR